MKQLSSLLSALPASAALSVDLQAKARAAAGADIISFCVGEPDFGVPEAAKRADVRAVEQGDTKYTNASGARSLKQAAAAALKRDFGLFYAEDEIAVTTGAKYAVYAAVRALVNPGDEIVLPAPYWTSYSHIIRLAGAVPVTVFCGPETGWKLTPSQLQSAVTEKTKTLILNNPNNPTGAVYSRAELEGLSAVCRACDLYVLSDEIYGRLIYTDAPFCAAAAVNADMRARTVTVNGVSKAYAMTGFRIGFAAGSAEIIRAVSAFISHTTGSPNTAAQRAAEAALLGPQTDTERMRQVFMQRRDALLAALSGIPGIGFAKPEGAFYLLLDLRSLLSGNAWADEAVFALQLLEEEGVAAVPCGDFGAPGFLRLSYTLDTARMLEGIGRLKRFIERNR